MNGASVRLADYKGKVILINFWATWCPPCKTEIPGFIELYDQYKDKGFVILGVSGDDDAGDAADVRAGVEDQLPDARRPRRRPKLLDAYGPLFGLSDIGASSGATARSAAGTSGPPRRRSSSRRSRRSCSMIALTMLKGFTHARLACGCRISFREGVEGSPVTVVDRREGRDVRADPARARPAALRLSRGAASLDPARAPATKKSTKSPELGL